VRVGASIRGRWRPVLFPAADYSYFAPRAPLPAGVNGREQLPSTWREWTASGPAQIATTSIAEPIQLPPGAISSLGCDPPTRLLPPLQQRTATPAHDVDM
jgi:hypothetical protein